MGNNRSVVNVSTGGQSEQKIQRDPGFGPGGAFYNAFFGIPQRIAQGQFITGEASEFVVPSRGHLDGILKSQSTKQNQRNRDDLIRQLREEHNVRQGKTFEGSPLFNQFSENIGQLANQAPGSQYNALLGLIENGGNPVDVSAIADSQFTDLKEQFSGFGGLFGTDFQAASGRNALELGVGAEENARNRQLGALGLAENYNPLGFDIAGTAAGRNLALVKSIFQPQTTNPNQAAGNSFSFGGNKQEGGTLDAVAGVFNSLSQ